jgi:acetyl esterase/lipase
MMWQRNGYGNTHGLAFTVNGSRSEWIVDFVRPSYSDWARHIGENVLPPPEPPPLLSHPGSPAGKQFAKQAATFSLIAPLAAFFIGIFLQPQVRGNRLAMMILGLASVFLILSGLVLGVVALIGTRRLGRTGILGKAIAGTCINGFLVLIMLASTPALLKAIAEAKQIQLEQSGGESLAEARKGFTTKLLVKRSGDEPVPLPPKALFNLVSYDSPAGTMAAYLSPAPGDGQRHPAIIWIFGGFGNGIGETAWDPAERKNDQSARAFREAGVIMMYPSMRGGNQNPGNQEAFYGEVDDVIAARDFLAKQDCVDPMRIYLAGHSTGGTMALLVAESTPQFRAVFAFGPVSDIRGYGQKVLPFDVHDANETRFRSPGLWLRSIKNPTFIFEGMNQPGNIGELKRLQNASQNPLIHFCPVSGVNHFSILAPITKLVAAKIVEDNSPTPGIDFSTDELDRAVSSD